VLNLLLRWRQDNEAVFLRGNHEIFLPRFLADSRTLDEWRQYGGLETLLSYGLKPTINPDRHEQVRLADELADALPSEHLDFLESLDLFYSCGDFLFVMPVFGPASPSTNRQKTICSGSARSFSPTNNRSNGLSFTATRR
jgi:serine/threonine protein phosphatase 1